MKTTKKWSKMLFAGMTAMVLAFGLSLTGCATHSSIGGTADVHGLLSKAPVVAEGAQEIASYSVIMWLIDSGYENYAAAVKKAESGGKKVTSVTKSYFGFFTKVTAYAQ
jgi:hypothetical protein